MEHERRGREISEALTAKRCGKGVVTPKMDKRKKGRLYNDRVSSTRAKRNGVDGISIIVPDE